MWDFWYEDFNSLGIISKQEIFTFWPGVGDTGLWHRVIHSFPKKSLHFTILHFTILHFTFEHLHFKLIFQPDVPVGVRKEGLKYMYSICSMCKRRGQGILRCKCLLSATFFSQSLFSSEEKVFPWHTELWSALPAPSALSSARGWIFWNMENSNNEQMFTAAPQEKSEAATSVSLQSAVENSEFNFQAAWQLGWVSFNQMALLNKCSLLCL